MRIYFICKRNYTNKDLIKDKFGRLYYLPVELAKNGVKIWVEVIDYRNNETDEFVTQGVNFRTIPLKFSNFFTIPYKIYRKCLSIKPDLIIGSGDSHIGFLGSLVARKLQVPFVFDVYDYYPAFEGNSIPGMKQMFRYTVRKSNLVLCSSTSLIEKLAPLNKNHLLIENGVDTSIFFPMDMIKARKILNLQLKNTLIGYFGSIDQTRGPILIEACRIIRKKYPSLELILAGKNNRVDLNEPWIKYLGELPQREIPALINSCNVVTIPYDDTLFNRMCGACKIAEYLACERPAVATKISENSHVLSYAHVTLCEPTPESMAEGISRQLLVKENPQFPQHLAWEMIAAKLHRSFYKLLGP